MWLLVAVFATWTYSWSLEGAQATQSDPRRQDAVFWTVRPTAVGKGTAEGCGVVMGPLGCRVGQVDVEVTVEGVADVDMKRGELVAGDDIGFESVGDCCLYWDC